MNRVYFFSVLLLTAFGSRAQYRQAFDSLTSNGSSLYDKLPEGWGVCEIGTGSAADGKYAVDNGANTTGNAYSFGAAGSAERALGTLASNTNFPTLGAIFFKETELPITAVTVTYTGEQWRYGGRTAPVAKDVLKFEYSLDAQGIVNNAGTWVRVTALDFQSPYNRYVRSGAERQ